MSSSAHAQGWTRDQSTTESVWESVPARAGLSLVMGAVLAPTAAWLAEVPHRRLYRKLVGVATALVFAIFAQQFPLMPALLATSVFAAVAVMLAAVDVLAHRLPRTLIWPTCATVTALLTAEIFGNGEDGARLLRAGAAALMLATGYLAIALASRGGLGAGDVRAAFLVGGVLGWHGWPALVAGTMLGFLASAIGAALVGLVHRRAAIPMGPAWSRAR